MKMSVKRSLCLSAAVATLGFASMANASVLIDTQVLSVSGAGLTMVDAHHVNVTATGGTISFGVFAIITNSIPTNSDMNNGFQTTRGYVLEGLPTGSGAVAGNNGPKGNLTVGAVVTPFNNASKNGLATDLNGDGFTEYGSLITDANNSIGPHSAGVSFNQDNATGNIFKIYKFSMPVTSLGGGTTNVNFVNTGTGASILWAEGITTTTSDNNPQPDHTDVGGAAGDYFAKNTTNGTVNAGSPVVLTSPAAAGATSFALGNTATNTPTTPASFVITANATGYQSAGTTITPVATGSIGLNNITTGMVEVLIHSSKTLGQLTTPSFPGGTAVDLTGSLAADPEAATLLGYYPWANILIRYPGTTDANNAFFNFDLSSSSATIDQIAAVPEPASLGLMAIGTIALLARRRK